MAKHSSKSKSGSNGMMIGIIVFIILAIIIGAGVYYYKYQSTTTTTTTPSTPSSTPTATNEMNTSEQIKSKWGYFKNAAKGNCLTMMGTGQPNDNVDLSGCTQADSQLWELTPDMTMIHFTDRLCLDPAGYEAAKGSAIGVYTCDAGSAPGGDQTWKIDPIPGDPTKFRFMNQKSNLCLDTIGTGGDAGSNLVIGDCSGGVNQQWSFDPSPKNVSS